MSELLKSWKFEIPCKNYGNHEILRILCNNNENNENLIIPCEHLASHEIHRISLQNHKKYKKNICVTTESRKKCNSYNSTPEQTKIIKI